MSPGIMVEGIDNSSRRSSPSIPPNLNDGSTSLRASLAAQFYADHTHFGVNTPILIGHTHFNIIIAFREKMTRRIRETVNQFGLALAIKTLFPPYLTINLQSSVGQDKSLVQAQVRCKEVKKTGQAVKAPFGQ